MSTDRQSTIIPNVPHHIRLAQTLSEATQTTVAALLNLLPADCIDNVQLNDEAINENSPTSTSIIMIRSMVDGRGLACPMPLLKTKVALRDVNIGESLYVVATDPNSQADIMAFCQQTQKTANPLLLIVNQTTDGLSNDGSTPHTVDTIFHFIITKTDSN
ncbi:sulfurtransferase TusA family protein [Psychrobacter frigidicola]|uniref:Sulfurtransferase TusA family protein n=1 Tax=Psychrobacter frigidicola TaxID=45611 RepID=A0A5C7A897_9GAMM|nr:sulfurtransferase TusA family protein [Psychrobacter frigidicola]TXD96980.1 sulfurtransferase TusA family protein [Psychrobacter frigidicola]